MLINKKTNIFIEPFQIKMADFTIELKKYEYLKLKENFLFSLEHHSISHN